MRILLSYGSLTGNTQMICDMVFEKLHPIHTIELEDQTFFDIQKISSYDLIIFATSTWGEGEPNPTTVAFIESLRQNTDILPPFHAAIFGLGDRAYGHFCGAVDQLESVLSEKHVILDLPSLRLDGFPDEVMLESIMDWLAPLLRV